ncbi:Chromosome transmission fidelity protein 18 [Recurvomyces mirabilis]|uniref:Chromosome transmission fidelity protein 18 n=1 Tax=Recurvomyces mirabilis TaxID=574656 RepID=A0AAE0TPT2_9PEZI|nr:Chromosome transmission fidelity protein 18 [Recurvomyces mirabilis]KAK5150135.1 Chromosome transmission fidelity protein 18 [Recurvomyces mirabilis]
MYLFDSLPPRNSMPKPEHSYGLPVPFRTLSDFCDSPTRLRWSPVLNGRRNIVVASLHNRIIAISISSIDDGGLGIYERLIHEKYAEQIIWLSACLVPHEEIREVAVRSLWNVDRSRLDECGICLSTSYGRQIVFAAHVISERQPEYEYTRLVNATDLVVGGFFLNEQYDNGDQVRLAVACRIKNVHDQDYDIPRDMFQEAKVSSPPLDKRVGFFFRACDVDHIMEAHVCHDDSMRCFGIRIGDDVLGQWREGRRILHIRDLSAWFLENRTVSRGTKWESPAVFLKRQSELPHLCGVASRDIVPIAGVLEWWTGVLGDHVQQVSSRCNSDGDALGP